MFKIILVFFITFNSYALEKVILKGEGHSSRQLTRAAYEKKLTPYLWKNETHGSYELETVKNKNSLVAESTLTLDAEENQKPWTMTDEQRKFRTNMAMLAGPAFITAYGVAFWDWGRKGLKFRTRDEGWFGRHTYAGGADKLAHGWSHFMITRGYYNLFQEMGWSPTEANLRAMMGAAATGLFIEIGDGLSHYGFSTNDLIVDLLGVGLAGLLQAYPYLDELIGFQINYWNNTEYPDGQRLHVRDPIDDYNNQKYVLNLRMSGIPVMKDHWYTRYFNLDMGYYSRGYDDDIHNPTNDPTLFKRYMFVGMSLNLWKLIEDPNPRGKWNTIFGSLFKYAQTPYNAIEFHADETAGKNLERLTQ